MQDRTLARPVLHDAWIATHESGTKRGGESRWGDVQVSTLEIRACRSPRSARVLTSICASLFPHTSTWANQIEKYTVRTWKT